MGAWKRCQVCRKVLAAETFAEGSETCTPCLSGPVAKPRQARASAVKTVRSAAPVEQRSIVGSGDLEVRERRAKKVALEQLAEVHAEDYAQLLQAARRAEGLRA